ncbi:unnamed protein product [Prorocentrum cordatum]|uniref:Centrosomal protein of 19 kDa n=1 Tax=Prorocentrum cordatum TaxID=2364126 RepID=A0ABN9XPH8_9DINO|nr:unnamed protein product [Polarella glacialis]
MKSVLLHPSRLVFTLGAMGKPPPPTGPGEAQAVFLQGIESAAARWVPSLSDRVVELRLRTSGPVKLFKLQVKKGGIGGDNYADQQLVLSQESEGSGKGVGGGKGVATTAETAADVTAGLMRLIGNTKDLQTKAKLLEQLEVVDKPGYAPVPSLTHEEALGRGGGAGRKAGRRRGQAVVQVLSAARRSREPRRRT